MRVEALEAEEALPDTIVLICTISSLINSMTAGKMMILPCREIQ